MTPPRKLRHVPQFVPDSLTLNTLLETACQRGLDPGAVHQLLEAMEADAEDFGESFWNRFGGPLVDRLERMLSAGLAEGPDAAWEAWFRGDDHPMGR